MSTEIKQPAAAAENSDGAGSKTKTTARRKRALVTGASGGIGGACARALSRDCDVIVHYSGNQEGAQAVLDTLEPGQHRMIRFDVTDADAVKEAMAELEKEGGIDILVNNAGITRDGLLMRMKDSDFDDVIAANLKGSYSCIRNCVRGMVKRRYGRIICLSSVVGVNGNAGQANYAASKAGIIGLTKSVAQELGSRGITANAVAPGFIQTPMTASMPEKTKNDILGRIPAARFGTPEDVAAVVNFLASEEAGYVNGQVIEVDGGMA
ncbi:MAG: 3-oxoacyl-[acyl-carrier-protein] reductase [Eubacteriaceae bacterium]|jgi:3-oxoacyl-[acyl-carrier protein] reductase